MKKRMILILMMLLLLSGISFGQDSRYDAGLNLPFNRKAGDVNPQTGNLSFTVTDLSLPGRAGLNFSFSRTWSLNQSNAYAVNQAGDGINFLSTDTPALFNHMGVGWSASLPYIFSFDNAPATVKSLFFGGNVYELETESLDNASSNRSNIRGYDLLDLRVYSGIPGSEVTYGDCGTIPTDFGISDQLTDLSEYVLILKDNSKYYFRPDGNDSLDLIQTDPDDCPDGSRCPGASGLRFRCSGHKRPEIR